MQILEMESIATYLFPITLERPPMVCFPKKMQDVQPRTSPASRIGDDDIHLCLIIMWVQLFDDCGRVVACTCMSPSFKIFELNDSITAS
jgi:hypothetical protein